MFSFLVIAVCHGGAIALLGSWWLAAKGNDPEIVRESERRRYADPAAVDRVIELDGLWRDGAQL